LVHFELLVKVGLTTEAESQEKEIEKLLARPDTLEENKCLFNLILAQLRFNTEKVNNFISL